MPFTINPSELQRLRKIQSEVDQNLRDWKERRSAPFNLYPFKREDKLDEHLPSPQPGDQDVVPPETDIDVFPIQKTQSFQMPGMADPLSLNGFNLGTILRSIAQAPKPQELKFAPEEKLSLDEEAKFQNWIRGLPWWDEFVKQYGEEPRLDGGDYNYRAAWKAGIEPKRYAPDGGRYHWPSSLPSGELLKSARHPTLWKELEMRKTGKNPDER